MEVEQGAAQHSDMIQSPDPPATLGGINPEISAELARSLMELENLRQSQAQLETTSMVIMHRVDKALRENRPGATHEETHASQTPSHLS